MNLKTTISILLVSVCLSFSSCASVTPVTHERETIAYEGNEQTAGIVGFLEDGSLEIKESARVRYNALIEAYGKRTTPVTEMDFQIKKLKNGNYSLSKEGAERWYELKLIQERKRINDSEGLINL